MLKAGSILLPETDSENENLLQYVRDRIPAAQEVGFQNGRAVGVVRRGKLAGCCVFHNFRGFDVEMSAAFDDPLWCLPQTMRALFHIPFVQYGCKRMTTITSKNNKRALKSDLRMGFKVEGVIRQGYDGETDAVVLGLLRSECRWLSKMDREDNGNK